MLGGSGLDALDGFDAGNGDGIKVHRGVEHLLLARGTQAKHLPHHHGIDSQHHQRDGHQRQVEHRHDGQIEHHRHHVQRCTGCQHPGNQPGALVHRRAHGQGPCADRRHNPCGQTQQMPCEVCPVAYRDPLGQTGQRGELQPAQGELHHSGSGQKRHDGRVAVTVTGHQHGVDEKPHQRRDRNARDDQRQTNHQRVDQGAGSTPVLLGDAPADVCGVGDKGRSRHQRWDLARRASGRRDTESMGNGNGGHRRGIIKPVQGHQRTFNVSGIDHSAMVSQQPRGHTGTSGPIHCGGHTVGRFVG